jgi:putative SOS response-associated peptidase YedK
MPVILDPKVDAAWLDPNHQDIGELQNLLLRISGNFQ